MIWLLSVVWRLYACTVWIFRMQSVKSPDRSVSSLSILSDTFAMIIHCMYSTTRRKGDIQTATSVSFQFPAGVKQVTSEIMIRR